MRIAYWAALLASPVVAASLAAQTAPDISKRGAGPADLCAELIAFAEKEVAAKRSPEGKQQNPQAGQSANLPAPRTEEPGTGRQGAGSADGKTSSETGGQTAAPPTTPVSPGAAPEAAASPHATDKSSSAPGATPEGATEVPPEKFELAQGVTLEQLRGVVKAGDRKSCRDAAQKLRRAGVAMPATLLALAALEPRPAKAQQ